MACDSSRARTIEVLNRNLFSKGDKAAAARLPALLEDGVYKMAGSEVIEAATATRAFSTLMSKQQLDHNQIELAKVRGDGRGVGVGSHLAS